MFAESLSRAIVEVKNENVQEFENIIAQFDISCVCIGLTGGDVLDINETVVKNVKDLQDVYFNKFEQVINQDI